MTPRKMHYYGKEEGSDTIYAFTSLTAIIQWTKTEGREWLFATDSRVRKALRLKQTVQID